MWPLSLKALLKSCLKILLFIYFKRELYRGKYPGTNLPGFLPSNLGSLQSCCTQSRAHLNSLTEGAEVGKNAFKLSARTRYTVCIHYDYISRVCFIKTLRAKFKYNSITSKSSYGRNSLILRHVNLMQSCH